MPSPVAERPAERVRETLLGQLGACYQAHEVKWKPQAISGNRAMAVAYVDARVVQDRLDAVVGVDGWQDEYECLPDGGVVCRLRLRLGEQWITKMDVGGPSEQPDEGDRRKAAFSDALKRAAVKFGVGRYLYRLPSQWVDYDPQKRQFTRPPKLPEWALPTTPPPEAAASPPPSKPRPKKEYPADGAELERWIEVKAANLSRDGYPVTHAELLAHVRQAVKGVNASWAESAVASWGADAIRAGTDTLKTRCRELVAAGKTPAPTAPPAPASVAPDPSEVIGPLAVAALERELARVGESWRNVRDYAGLPAGTATKDLTHAQYAAAMQLLAPLPPAAGK